MTVAYVYTQRNNLNRLNRKIKDLMRLQEHKLSNYHHHVINTNTYFTLKTIPNIVPTKCFTCIVVSVVYVGYLVVINCSNQYLNKK